MASLKNINVITSSTKAQDSNFQNKTIVGNIVRKVFKILFYLHLILISLLVISLTIYGLITTSQNHNFHLMNWYPPLFTSITCAGVFGFIWQWITLKNPKKAIRATFWLSPLLTCAMAIMFVYIESPISLAFGVIALVFSLIQSLYGCWVNHRFEYANKILSTSLVDFPIKTMWLTFSSIFIGIIYCFFLVIGIGGARAIENKTKLTSLFILLILLSLGWSMQFLKNVIQVTISRIKYMNLGFGEVMDTRVAFNDTLKYLSGSVSIGSILVPFISTFRGFARSLKIIGGDSDEFMFSCVSCYMGIATILVSCGNRFGFVHVGVYNKGFVQASCDIWDMFNRVGLVQLIDLDLTGSFCFLSGVAGGAISSLVSGIWSIVLQKNYATELSIYAFLIGYFMVRLALAWPQACVSAYYVAYAENPQSTHFDSTIPMRLEQLQRSQV
ncbi:protein PNS1-like [Trifolium pratense]|nr:protein PNS1-like [Trifolium pratense]